MNFEFLNGHPILFHINFIKIRKKIIIAIVEILINAENCLKCPQFTNKK